MARKRATKIDPANPLLRAELIEDGRVLVWPTSGLSDAQKLQQALDAADAKREGRPFNTASGTNLGRELTPDEPAGEVPAEQLRKEKKWRKKKPKVTAAQLRAEIKRLEKQLMKQSRWRKSGAPSSKKRSPATNSPSTTS